MLPNRFWAALALGVLAACSAPGPDLDVVLASEPAETLSAYELFTDLAKQEPNVRVVKYDLINPLFSDYAAKHRFVFVPTGEAAEYVDEDTLRFPIGSVLVKTFAFAPDMRVPEMGTYLVETRLLIHKEEGWVAYPYVWNEAQTDATYAPIGKRLGVSTITPKGEQVSFTYSVPNKNQCKTCHQNGDMITPIGPKTRNLNHVGPQGMNQIKDWVERGLLSEIQTGLTSVGQIGSSEASLEDQARGYLDINCAHCHKANGSASNSGLWLDYGGTDPTKLGVGKHPTAAGRGSGNALVVLDPGSPKHSILAYRMASDEAGVAMPELGRALIHEEGVSLIERWIAEMNHDYLVSPSDRP